MQSQSAADLSTEDAPLIFSGPYNNIPFQTVNSSSVAGLVREHNALGFIKVNSKSQKLSVEMMVREKLKWQPEMLKIHPEMPQIKLNEVITFQDFAYAVHDQSEFLF